MIIRSLGLQPYQSIWDQMKRFTLERNEHTEDEIWLLQHFPVYTQGQAGKKEHILNPGNIPIVQSDRGGQVTYHGPGQLVAYILIDLKRKALNVRSLVNKLEGTMVSLLQTYNILAQTRCRAPGVYVQESKIASIGLRIKNNCSYHGLALNVSMDLKPFEGINPCGFAKLKMTQIKEHYPQVDFESVSLTFADMLLTEFG